MKYLKKFEVILGPVQKFGGKKDNSRDIRNVLENNLQFFLANVILDKYEIRITKNTSARFRVTIDESTNSLIYSMCVPKDFDFEGVRKELEGMKDEIEFRNCYISELGAENDQYAYLEIEFELTEYLEKLLDTNQRFYDLVVSGGFDLPEEFKGSTHLGIDYGFYDQEK
jgi:hypothetical protein